MRGYVKATALREHKAFVLEGLSASTLASRSPTNANLAPDSIQRVADSGIHYLGAVNSGETLAGKVSACASEHGWRFDEIQIPAIRGSVRTWNRGVHSEL
jgi:hypothetical protein